MDLGTYLEEYPEYEYDDLKRVKEAAANKAPVSRLSKIHGDRKSTPMATKCSKGGSKPDNLCEIPNV